jgi:hypothetical protein
VAADIARLFRGTVGFGLGAVVIIFVARRAGRTNVPSHSLDASKADNNRRLGANLAERVSLVDGLDLRETGYRSSQYPGYQDRRSCGADRTAVNR